MNNGDIDFVITWVDGNDSVWKAEKELYENTKSDDREERYRDWDNLQYWFRGVECFAPWFHKVYFVTYGHIPSWLNTSNPKLQIVNHRDFIPEEYLPTFSSHTIELNLHRIKGLSEQFVYFNDDMFIIRPVDEGVFFKNGLPCDSAVLNAMCFDRIPNSELLFMMPAYDMVLINFNFDKNTTIKKKPSNWFNLKYGKDLLRTFSLMPWKHFPGFVNYHLPYSWLKTTLEDVWEKERAVLNETCSHRFRMSTDVNSWLISYWQFAQNSFCPRSSRTGIEMGLNDDDNTRIYDIIRNQRRSLICVNDVVRNSENFRKIKKELNECFDRILPNKSSFEV